MKHQTPIASQKAFNRIRNAVKEYIFQHKKFPKVVELQEFYPKLKEDLKIYGWRWIDFRNELLDYTKPTKDIDKKISRKLDALLQKHDRITLEVYAASRMAPNLFVTMYRLKTWQDIIKPNTAQLRASEKGSETTKTSDTYKEVKIDKNPTTGEVTLVTETQSKIPEYLNDGEIDEHIGSDLNSEFDAVTEEVSLPDNKEKKPYEKPKLEVIEGGLEELENKINKEMERNGHYEFEDDEIEEYQPPKKVNIFTVVLVWVVICGLTWLLLSWLN